MNENFTGNFIFIKDVNFCTVLVNINKLIQKVKMQGVEASEIKNFCF